MTDIVEINHSWSIDGYSVDQCIQLENSTLRLWRDANVDGHHRLEVRGDLEAARDKLSNIKNNCTMDEACAILEGREGYGADLRDIANWMGLEWDGESIADNPNLEEHPNSAD